MMTIKFFVFWMIGSCITFSILNLLAGDLMDRERGSNTWCVLFAQAMGAVIAYALY